MYHAGTETIHGKIKELRYTLSSYPIRRTFLFYFPNYAKELTEAV